MRHYFDYNGSAPLRPEARAACREAMEVLGNPSSVHEEGRRARAIIERARENVASLLSADRGNVVFTSGGTEANVTALCPWYRLGRRRPVGAVAVSAIEHPSVLSGGRFDADALNCLPVTSGGIVDLVALDRWLAGWRARRHGAVGEICLVSVMHANNETGIVQPIAEIADLVHGAGGLVHTDAAQTAGRIPVDIGRLGVDVLSVSAHKFGGPRGVGALVFSEADVGPEGLLTGGGQEGRRRAGTEDVVAIAGFGAAAAAAAADLASGVAPAMIAALTDDIATAVRGIAPEALVFGRDPDVERLANTVCFAVPGISAQTLVIAFDLAGIAVSAGASCSSGRLAGSHVLSAMDVPQARDGAVRVSLGWSTNHDDVAAFKDAFALIYQRVRQVAPVGQIPAGHAA